MNLSQFLVYHVGKMLHCFILEHYEVSLLRLKKMPAVFDILVDYEYMDAVIRYGEKVEAMWKTGQTEAILESLAHELTHIFTGSITEHLKMTKRMRIHEERATVHISRLLYKLYKKELRNERTK